MHSPVPDTHPDHDHDLARRATAGDADALERLAHRVLPDVRRWCLAIVGDPVAADDAVQEALVRLIRFIGRYDPERPLRPWLRTLVRSACLDGQRRSARRTPGPVSPTGHSPEPRDPGRDLDLERGAARALEAYGELSPRQREVWTLCHREGLSAADAARQLDIAPGTARALLYQARRTLRLQLLEAHPDLLDLVRIP